MSNVLVLRTSVNGDKSFSNQLIDQFIAKTRAKWPEVNIIERDLDANLKVYYRTYRYLLSLPAAVNMKEQNSTL